MTITGSIKTDDSAFVENRLDIIIANERHDIAENTGPIGFVEVVVDGIS